MRTKADDSIAQTAVGTKGSEKISHEQKTADLSPTLQNIRWEERPVRDGKWKFNRKEKQKKEVNQK